MYPDEIIAAIKEDAILKYPEESCGIIVRKTDDTLAYISMENHADDPRVSFHIQESLLVRFIPSLVAIVHSHPNGPDCPSEADMRQQLRWNVPFGIVTTDGVGCMEPFFWGGDTERPPLIGRGFRHGVTDCYALIRDYYKLNLDIELSEYPRDWEWWDDGKKLYEEHFGDENFVRVDDHDVREHDIFLATIRSDTPNHAGIYVGGNLILHHLTSRLPADPSRLSKREPIGAWSKFICGFWIRHKELMT